MDWEKFGAYLFQGIIVFGVAFIGYVIVNSANSLDEITKAAENIKCPIK